MAPSAPKRRHDASALERVDQCPNELEAKGQELEQDLATVKRYAA